MEICILWKKNQGIKDLQSPFLIFLSQTALCLFSIYSTIPVTGHELVSHKLPLLPNLDYVTDTMAVLSRIFHFSQESRSSTTRNSCY